jgi:hypothetical protein
MIHCTGWYFCTKSNWDNNIFDARNLVDIPYKDIDWENLIISSSLFPKDEYNSYKNYNELKPEVFIWLTLNIKDQKLGLKGWCCGNKDYNSNTYEGFSLFFYRRKDAINFIKTWSFYKKPTETYNQNTYIKKILNIKTNKLEIVKNN